MQVKQGNAVGWFFIEFRFKLLFFIKTDLHVQERDSSFGIGECVFDGEADCIHECHQGVKLGVGTEENEEDVINKTFLKVDQVEESQDYDAFFFSHEQTDIGGSHPSSHGGTQDLVYVRIHEFEGAMFEDEIEYYAHNMGWWPVCWQQVLVFLHEVIQSCYVFFVWNFCLQGRDISCDQEGIGWKGCQFLDDVEKMFCVFDVGWEVAS